MSFIKIFKKGTEYELNMLCAISLKHLAIRTKQ